MEADIRYSIEILEDEKKRLRELIEDIETRIRTLKRMLPNEAMPAPPDLLLVELPEVGANCRCQLHKPLVVEEYNDNGDVG